MNQGDVERPAVIRRDEVDGIAYELRPGETDVTPILLLHSLATDARTWRPVIDALATQRTIVTLDARGHGRSERAGVVRPDAWASDTIAVLDAAGLERAVLVGVSMGGLQAIATAAADASRVAGIVIADSFLALPTDVARARIDAMTGFARAHSMHEVAAQYARDTFEEDAHPSSVASVTESMSVMEREAFIAAVRSCFEADVTEAAVAVSAPALVLWGTHDRKTPRPLSETIAERIAGARLREIPGAGHLSHLDRPEAFAEAVEAFARQIDRARIDRHPARDEEQEQQ